MTLRLLSLLTVTFVLSFSPLAAYSQEATKAGTKGGSGATASSIAPTTAPFDLARAALNAHGGDKFKTVKSMILRGSVDLYAPNSTQPRPGTT